MSNKLKRSLDKNFSYSEYNPKNKILCGVNHSNIPIHILQKITNKKLLLGNSDTMYILYIDYDDDSKNYYLDGIHIDDGLALLHLVDISINNIKITNIQNFVGKKYLFVDKKNNSLLIQIEKTVIGYIGPKIKILHNDLVGAASIDSTDTTYTFNKLYEIE